MSFGGFSWKRALGVTKTKQKIARATGIPTTKAGRKRTAKICFGKRYLVKSKYAATA